MQHLLNEEKQPLENNYRALVVESPNSFSGMPDAVCSEKNIENHYAFSEEEARELLAPGRFQMVIIAMDQPGLDGGALLKDITRRYPDIDVVMTGEDEAGAVIEAMRSGAVDYLVKPFTAQELSQVLDRVRKRREAKQDTEDKIPLVIKQLSHDIRGGLLHVAMMVKLLLRGRCGELGEDALRQLEKIYAGTDHLMGISEDYCSLAYALDQGEAPAEHLDPEKDVIARVVEEFAFDIEQKEITLKKLDTWRSTSGQPAVKANRLLLGSVFRTLFSNAVRHCRQQGRITYECGYKDGRFHFAITNDGRPIAREVKQAVFRDFFQATASASTGEEKKDLKTGSLGIGLSLARTIVREHGGTICCEPWPEGTSFFLTLPAERQTAPRKMRLLPFMEKKRAAKSTPAL